jgi:hypothetical protein
MLSPEDVKLLNVVRSLCMTVRQPLKFERVKTWLKQFGEGAEYTLALLILRHLIYRTHDQIESSLTQALRRMAMHFVHNEHREQFTWQEIISGKTGLDFFFGPPAHDGTPPGKSGELIIRLLKHKFGIPGSKIHYPNGFSELQEYERYLLVDDGTFTGEQLSQYLDYFSAWKSMPGRIGIVVAIAHEEALKFLEKSYPHISVFYGEKMTEKDGLVALSDMWEKTGRWRYTTATPLEVYNDIATTKAKFQNSASLGFASLGLLVAYEHGVPDDSLELLWSKSPTWTPLFDR